MAVHHGKTTSYWYHIVVPCFPPFEGDDAAIGLLRYAQQPNGSILSEYEISVTSFVEATR